LDYFIHLFSQQEQDGIRNRIRRVVQRGSSYPPPLLANSHQHPEVLPLAQPVSQPSDTIERQTVLVRHFTQIILPRLGSNRPIHQQKIAHIPIPSAESRVPAACGLPSGEDGLGREKRNRRPGAGQRAKPATRGRLFPLWERKGKAPVFPLNKQRRRSASLNREAENYGTLARRNARGPAGQFKNAAPLGAR